VKDEDRRSIAAVTGHAAVSAAAEAAVERRLREDAVASGAARHY